METPGTIAVAGATGRLAGRHPVVDILRSEGHNVVAISRLAPPPPPPPPPPPHQP